MCKATVSHDGVVLPGYIGAAVFWAVVFLVHRLSRLSRLLLPFMVLEMTLNCVAFTHARPWSRTVLENVASLSAGMCVFVDKLCVYVSVCATGGSTPAVT